MKIIGLITFVGTLFECFLQTNAIDRATKLVLRIPELPLRCYVFLTKCGYNFRIRLCLNPWPVIHAMGSALADVQAEPKETA